MTAHEMKDSGVDWIGEIPISWRVIPNKYVMKKIKNIRPTYNGDTILSLSQKGVIVRNLENPSGKMPTTFDGYQFIEKGNLLMCLFDIDVTPRCIGLIKNDGLCSPAYSQFVLDKNGYAPYYYYYYLNLDFTKELLHLAKNLRHSLNEEQLGNVKIPCPPVKEQISIANFLDAKCSEIDSLTADIEKQIETLQEYKKSVITDAVTKGLDTNVEMKDSGVEWIGIMPEAWGLKPLKYCVFLKTNKSKTNEGYVGLEHVKSWSGQLIPPDGDEFIAEGEALTFTKGDVLFGKLRPYLAKCFLASCDGSCSTEFLVLKPTNVDEQFLKFLLLTPTFIDTVNMSTNGVKMPRANWDFVGSIKIPIPNKKEQTAIVNFLNTKCAEIDTIVKEKQKQLEVLAQYKQSLIYEYVTGKKAVPT